MSRIVLASGSPRRQELLNRIGITDFDIRVPQTDEHYPAGLTPAQIVEYISREKADAAAKLHGRAGLADDLLHHAVVRVRAVLSGVKVNHVYKVCTGIEEPLCGLDRVFCYFMCSAVVAFLQAHALSVLQIDCRNYLHFPTSVSFAKLRSI